MPVCSGSSHRRSSNGTAVRSCCSRRRTAWPKGRAAASRISTSCRPSPASPPAHAIRGTRAGGRPRPLLERLDAFREGLAAIADLHARETPIVRRRTIDAQLRVAEITPGLLSDLDRLRPFGAGNEEPLFLLSNARVAAISRIGARGRHLRFAWRKTGGVFPAWRSVGRRSRLRLGRSDLLFAIHENIYRGARSIQLLLKDARPAGESVLCGERRRGRICLTQPFHRRSSP